MCFICTQKAYGNTQTKRQLVHGVLSGSKTWSLGGGELELESFTSSFSDLVVRSLQYLYHLKSTLLNVLESHQPKALLLSHCPTIPLESLPRPVPPFPILWPVLSPQPGMSISLVSLMKLDLPFSHH